MSYTNSRIHINKAYHSVHFKMAAKDWCRVDNILKSHKKNAYDYAPGTILSIGENLFIVKEKPFDRFFDLIVSDKDINFLRLYRKTYDVQIKEARDDGVVLVREVKH